MSITSLKAFWDRAAYDPALQARLRAIKGDTTTTAIAEVVRIAAEFGFVFTPDEYLVGLPAIATAPPGPKPETEPTVDCCGHKMDC